MRPLPMILSRPHRAIQLVIACSLVLPPEVYGQQLETPRPPKGTPSPPSYLQPGALDYRSILAGPPSVGSLGDQVDIAIDQALEKKASKERWELANEDAKYVFDRFSDAFGKPLRRDSLPWTIHILYRALKTASGPTFEAKEAFHRPRPFQRYQVARVCGSDSPPLPETNPTEGSSYPSGHAVYGWTTALVLGAIVPDRAAALLKRAEEYGQSRLVCAVHFPSDVEAGRVLAVAAFEKIEENPEFHKELACAKDEYFGNSTCASPDPQMVEPSGAPH